MNKELQVNQNQEYKTVYPYSNIYDKDEKIILEVEMPGIKKEAIKIDFDGDNLVITGKKKVCDCIGKEYRAIYKERKNVQYYRNFKINSELDKENVNAEFNNGILKLTFKKSEKMIPKRIEIQ